MNIVKDVDRPDKNGKPPSMAAIADQIKKELVNLCPFLKIAASDNLCSGVSIQGSFDTPDTWEYGIFHNSRYFIFHIFAQNRYYKEGEKVNIHLGSYGLKLNLKFRKYTGTPEKCIEKLKTWILNTGG